MTHKGRQQSEDRIFRPELPPKTKEPQKQEAFENQDVFDKLYLGVYVCKKTKCVSVVAAGASVESCAEKCIEAQKKDNRYGTQFFIFDAAVLVAGGELTMSVQVNFGIYLEALGVPLNEYSAAWSGLINCCEDVLKQLARSFEKENESQKEGRQ